MAEGLLGAGTNQAYIYTRDGLSQLLPVPTTSIEWGRTLNGFSTTKINVDPARCSPKLGDVEAHAHNIVVFRNGLRVWEGPVWDRRDAVRGGLELVARDVIGGTGRRPVLTSRKVLGGLVRAQMQWSVEQAYALDDPNVLAHVQLLGTPTQTADLEVKVVEKYHLDVLSDMGDIAAGAMDDALG